MKMVHLNKHIDAINPDKSSLGRFANDHVNKTMINAEFITLGDKVFLKALRDLKPNEEVFINYGRGHWLFCTDLNVSEAFLGLKLITPTGVIATEDLDKSEMICVYSSLLWDETERFGNGLGKAIQTSFDVEKVNCEIIKNPFVVDTFMIRSIKKINKNERLFLHGIINTKNFPLNSIAITGFGKFRGVTVNPTSILIKNLKETISNNNNNNNNIFYCNVWTTSVKALSAGLEEIHLQVKLTNNIHHAISIHFGVYDGSDCFYLENTSYNEADFSVPDEEGKKCVREVIENGKTMETKRRTNLDLNYLVKELIKCDFNVEISNDPGRFICNYTYYKSLSFIENYKHVGVDDALFVHVPSFDAYDETIQFNFALKLIELIGNMRINRNFNNNYLL